MDAQGSLEKRITSCQLHGSIRTLSIRGNGHQIYAGTSENNVYRINIGEKSRQKNSTNQISLNFKLTQILENLAELSNDLLKTCHGSAVNDVVFPNETSALFATGGKGDVRIWETETGKELVRIEVPNITCNAGKSQYLQTVLWND